MGKDFDGGVQLSPFGIPVASVCSCQWARTGGIPSYTLCQRNYAPETLTNART